MKQQPDLSANEQIKLAEHLTTLICTGMKSVFQPIPKHCMLRYCYNPPTMAIKHQNEENFPVYICERCTKLVYELQRENSFFWPPIIELTPDRR